jgi:hypothetical protein
MQTLGPLQGLQFQESEDPQQLEACIANTKSAMDLSPAESPLRSFCFTNLSSWYMRRRYEVTRRVDDINVAIRMLEESRQSFEPDDPDREALCHSNMGILLSKRFQFLGDIKYLNRAITFAREAIEKTHKLSPARALCLGNLGSCLKLRFEQTESVSDFNEFVEAFEVSLKGVSPSDRISYIEGMYNLGTGLLIQYNFTGTTRDINRAIQLLVDAVDRTTNKNSTRAGILINLGSALVSRFSALSTTNDLARAFSCAREAMDIIPSGHPDRQRILNNLAIWLSKHAKKTGSLKELDQALEISRLALSTTTSGDPYHHQRARTVASMLIHRYRRTHMHEDIRDAIETLQFTIDCVQGDDQTKSQYMFPMSIALAERFEHTGDIADLYRAIQIVRQVLDTMHAESYRRTGTFKNLAGLLRRKTMGDYTAESRQQVLDAELAGFNCANGLPSMCIQLGRNAAAIYASRSDWVAANNIMKEIIRLIASVSPRALSIHDKQTSLEEATVLDGLASTAAAISLNAGDEPQDALQLLEQGHGIIGGRLTELRIEISDLKSAHPDLAQKIEHIRNQLDLPEELGNELDNAPGGVNRRHTLQDSLTCTIEEIRGLAGFESFLCPLTENQIKSAANVGPLVFVNAGHFRCDAFIVQEKKIGLVPLPDVNVPKTLEMASKLRTDTVSVLEWLWNSIANPVLNYLGFQQKPSDECWPHIWWVTMGLMSWFPLHASGIYAYPSEETVLDRVVSSYTSSIKSLIYSRKHRSQLSDAKAALLVSMPQTSGMSALPSAAAEVQMLREICQELGLQPVEPAYPTRDNVLTQLKKCKIFHFAGHGLSDRSEPSQSCLVVHDWEQNRLTVGDLRDLRLHEEAPFLSYLSACSTTSTSRDKLIDEGMHLVNACQLAGFRHVVGTLWDVSDEHCVDVATILYSTLREKGLTDEAVYYGLHREVRCLRDKDLRGGNSPLPPGSESGIVEEQPNDGDQSEPATSTTPGESSPASPLNQESKGRTAVPKRKPKHQPRWYWVPYVHFGV